MTLERDYATFLDVYPSYAETRTLDELRAAEFRRLDDQQLVYLDYTGGGLYPSSVVQRHAEFLATHVLGNPHSVNPASALAGERIETCRAHVLRFFNASPDEYAVVFTANASHALKLVGEAYPFEPGDRLLLTFDNHNSVNGIREFDRARGAETTYVPVIPPDLRVDAISSACSTGRRPAGTIFSPIRRSRTSRVYSTHSTGSRPRRPVAGTCCSTRRRSCRPTASTWVACIPTTSPSPSTRCSGIRPGSGC